MRLQVWLNDDESRWLDVEVADTPNKRIAGLSDRASMEPDAGMLFAWPDPVVVAFDARGTRFRIHAQAFDVAGRFVDEMWLEQGARGPFWFNGKFQYVLETNSDATYTKIELP